jgi:hypothetical protein
MKKIGVTAQNLVHIKFRPEDESHEYAEILETISLNRK